MIIPFVMWLVALQVRGGDAPFQSARSFAELFSVAGALAGLTVAVYRLGVWRQEMHNTKHNVGAEVARYREESNQNFARLDRRFTSIDRFIEAATEHRVSSERWQAGIDVTLAGVAARVDKLEAEEC
jgi:hypothetical protein